MKNFKINDKISIICDWKKTRMAFKHTAILMIDNCEADSTKICYLNRTWESYEYQSVLYKIIEKTKALTKEEKELCNDFIKNYKEESHFGALGAIALMGDIICDTQKTKNDWKARMLKAGLGEAIDMPEDWRFLSEDEKEKRLNSAIGELTK